MRIASLPRLVTAAVLVPALVLAGCASDDPGGTDTAASEANATSTSASATPASAADGSAAGSRERGDSIDRESSALNLDVAGLLGSAHDELGDIEVVLLMLYSDEASLMYVDPADPESTIRHEYRDATWDDPIRLPHPSTGTPLSLDQIDPDLLDTLIEAAPGEIGMTDTELDHLAIGADDAGDPEYLVVVIEGDALGNATFGHDGEVREVNDYR